jgi:hypothetical protein
MLHHKRIKRNFAHRWRKRNAWLKTYGWFNTIIYFCLDFFIREENIVGIKTAYVLAAVHHYSLRLESIPN